MNERRGVVVFFFFILLSVIILLQISLILKSEKFYKGLGRLDESFKYYVPPDHRIESSDDEQSPGDAGDWLVWAFRVEPKTLNLYSVESDIYSRWITVPYIVEPLLFYNYDTLEMEPWLAESWHVSDDGLEYSFVLRDDVYFSDGKPVTANDVIFTYETAVNPKVDASNVAVLYLDVVDAIKVDERTVKFVMKGANFKAIENLCFWDFGILPKHIYEFTDAEEFNKRVSNPVGSGPFIFEKWETGRQVVLRRNENYWGKKPKLEKIVYKFIPNSLAAVQALRSGEVDLTIPEPDQFADLVNDGEFTKKFRCLSYWNPGVPFYYLGWNQDKVFFKDKRVRRAMTHIIDREQIISKLCKGFAEPISGPFFIKGPFSDPSIKPWPYDLTEAKRLLSEAGWIDSDGDGIRDKDGVKFSFKFTYAAETAFYQRLVKLLKDEAEKVGVEVVPDPFEWSVLMPKISDRKFEAMVMGWGGDVMEEFYQIFHSSQIDNRGSNYVGFNNRQADMLLEQIRQTFDKNQRAKLCHKFHQILHEEQPYTFLFTRPTFRLLDKRFENVKIYTLGPKYWQWYVPKDKQRYN